MPGVPVIIAVLTCLYVLAALLLALYTLGQLLLLLRYWRGRHHPQPLPPVPWDALPALTLQLPIYNEQQVVRRLLAAVAALDYPRDRLHIQILDDSTDATTAVIADCVADLRRRGLAVAHVRRRQRSGYKAGALAHGLTLTEDAFVALLDADFVPPADFLRRTVPYLLADAGLGVVQTRWAHLNADENMLTRAQRLAIDNHFIVEQTARSQAGWFVPFNGTGGVWRTACIHAAGGWSAATLTEDLDLSYRAQLAGWRSLYVNAPAVPGELPPQLAAYRQQQQRWASGSLQCLLRLGGPVLRARRPWLLRLLALHHLCQYVPHPLMLTLLLLTPPLLLTGALAGLPLAPAGLMGLIPPLMLLVSQRALYPQAWRRHLLAFPLLALLATGLVWSNTGALLAALTGRGLAFERTPKFGQGWAASPYALRRPPLRLLELLLALYAAWGAALAARLAPALLPWLLIYALSFALVSLWGLRDAWLLERRPPAAPPPQAAPSAEADAVLLP